jgi:DNA adenine methylase
MGKVAVSTPLKTHGGKAYLAPRIVALFPPRDSYLHYVEPYAGGLSVLLANDPEGKSEVVNDLDGELTNFWTVLADPDLFADFRRRVESRPFSEPLWREVSAHRDQYGPFAGRPACGVDTRVMDACGFFTLCRQSLAGRKDAFAPLSRTRVRRGMNEQASAWLSAVEGLPAVHARLKRVVVLNRPALDVIRQQDGPRTLFYLDPPYAHDTRKTTGEYGAYEMSLEDHAELLQELGILEGRFVLSGYRNDMYDRTAEVNGWRRADFEISNHAAGGKDKRRMTESVWLNF